MALSHQGDADLGRAMFTRMACSQCHSVDGSGNKAGPDLSASGDKFPKNELIRAVLEPSSMIAVGYDNTVITRTDGTMQSGVIKQATNEWIELMGADGNPVRTATADIAKRETSPVSLMPEGLHLTRLARQLLPSRLVDPREPLGMVPARRDLGQRAGDDQVPDARGFRQSDRLPRQPSSKHGRERRGGRAEGGKSRETGVVLR